MFSKIFGEVNVNVLCGRFQPFHKGHLISTRLMKLHNDLPVVLIVVRGNKKNKKTVFDENIIFNMLDEILEFYPHIIGYTKIHSMSFDKELFPAMRPEWEPILLGAGEDRIDDYQRQIEWIKNKEDFIVKKNFSSFKLPRKYSATEVRKSIIEDNIFKFKTMMPKILYSYYNQLKENMLKNE